MYCEVVTFPDGTRAIVTFAGQRPRCGCGARGTLQCDWKVPKKKSGTCDRYICAKCTHSPAPDKDLCQQHAKEWMARRP